MVITKYCRVMSARWQEFSTDIPSQNIDFGGYSWTRVPFWESESPAENLQHTTKAKKKENSQQE